MRLESGEVGVRFGQGSLCGCLTSCASSSFNAGYLRIHASTPALACTCVARQRARDAPIPLPSDSVRFWSCLEHTEAGLSRFRITLPKRGRK